LLTTGFLLASTTAVGDKIDQTAILADGTAVHVTGDGDSLLRRVEITQNGQATVLFLTIGNDGQYELLSGTVLGGAMPDAILAGVADQISAATGKQVVYNEKNSDGGNDSTSEPPRGKKASSSAVGDKVRTPQSHPEDFVKVEGTKYRNKKTGEIWEKSRTTHTDKDGEWKVGSHPGKPPRPSDKITVGSNGVIIKF
jgi:filamentous hemagglutinin